MAEIRQTVKLAIDDSQQVSRKNIQYTTGFTLPLGKYHLKFVVRENQTGRMGSFETDINLPDLKKFPLKLSSVVLSSQRGPSGKKDDDNPLSNGGFTWVPNVAHVFRTDQHMYLLYEVYDPASAPASARRRRKARSKSLNQHRISAGDHESIRDSAGGGHQRKRARARCRRLCL